MKNVFTFFLLLSLLTGPLAAQSVTTWAGPGIGVDDGLILDSAGTLYASSYDDGNIFAIEPNGTVTLYASGMNAANGLAWDADGRLVVCDNTGNMIYKVAADSTLEPFAAIGSPSGLIKDPLSDTLYFTSYVGDVIYKLAPDSTVIPFVSGTPQNGLNGPVGLAWDDSLNLIVGNFTNDNVYKINRAGDIWFFGTFGMPSPLGFIAYREGYVYGTLFNSQRIMRLDSMGNAEWVAGSSVGVLDGPAATAQFNRPNGIINSLGGDSLIISGYGRKTIRVVTGLDSIGFVARDDMENELRGVEIYPNPVKDRIRVKGLISGMGEVQMEVLDLQGRVMRKAAYAEGLPLPLEFEVAGIPAGTYLLRVRADGKETIEKLVLSGE